MSKMGEIHAKQDHSMMECMIAEEEQAYLKAIDNVAEFINSGAVSFEQAINSILEACNE